MSDVAGMTSEQLVEMINHKVNVIEDLQEKLERATSGVLEFEDMRNEAANKAKDLENRCIQLQQMVNGQAAAMAKLTGQW